MQCKMRFGSYARVELIKSLDSSTMNHEMSSLLPQLPLPCSLALPLHSPSSSSPFLLSFSLSAFSFPVTSYFSSSPVLSLSPSSSTSFSPPKVLEIPSLELPFESSQHSLRETIKRKNRRLRLTKVNNYNGQSRFFSQSYGLSDRSLRFLEDLDLVCFERLEGIFIKIFKSFTKDLIFETP